MLLALVVVTLLSISDTRLILGINPWIKPMKFLISITIFLWTVGWFMPEDTPGSDLAAGASSAGFDRPWRCSIEIFLHHPAVGARRDVALQLQRSRPTRSSSP